MQKGVLIVNLGTPESNQQKDVRQFLIEFLTDKRVINEKWFKRQCLVRALIVPGRCRETTAAYNRIWTKNGSPIKFYGLEVQKRLQHTLGKKYKVSLAMRYQSPSIEKGLNSLKQCSEIIVLPLFPQYASATTGSIHQKVMRIISCWNHIPKLHFINSYPEQPQMIEAFYERGKEANFQDFEHIVFSFHGLPEQQILDIDCNNHCLKEANCCQIFSEKNTTCYAAQCYATAKKIAEKLNLSQKHYTICFQSRLGKKPWLTPYTSEILMNLLQRGIKNVLVYSPAFVCDCLETIDEIGNEYRKVFLDSGGKNLSLVTGLNAHPLWIEALKTLVVEH